MPVIVRCIAVAAAATLLAACTSSHPAGNAPPSRSEPSSSAGSAAIDAGPLRATDASACPYLRTAYVHETIGMRLGRLTVLRRGARVVGCRFYASQGSLSQSEHLPGPRQPVVEVVTRRYASATDAHNAFVIIARRGRNAQQVRIGRVPGVCFQIPFYPKDHGTDWACATSAGSTEVVVRTVDTTGTFNAAAIIGAVLSHV